MADIFGFFTTLGFFTTVYFIAKIIDEMIEGRRADKLAAETSRRLREERKREQLVAEWRNMTSAGTEGVMFHPTLGWLVTVKTSELRLREEPT